MSAHQKRMRFTLRVHPAGLGMLALAFVFAPSQLVLGALLALLWHEGAHVLAMALAGVSACRVELTPFGGMADVVGYERLTHKKQALIALSGVAASAVGAFCCMRFAPHSSFWYALGNMHFSLALLNCLPVWPLDGARVVMAMASRFGVQAAFRRGMLWLAYALGAAMVVLGLYGAWLSHMNPTLFLLAPYLCYAAHEAALCQGVESISRAESTGKKLAEGAVLPVRVLACEQEPAGIGLTRLMTHMPAGTYHLLCVVDHESGRVQKTLSEQELSAKLFANEKE
ncbi:MAG: hypothetical protein RSB06_02645 [Clostridia bacterium]